MKKIIKLLGIFVFTFVFLGGGFLQVDAQGAGNNVFDGNNNGVATENVQVVNGGDGTVQNQDTQGNETGKKKSKGCSGIKLNTNFPIIGNCIETKAGATNPTNAFPQMVGAITKIVLSLIFVVCFILIIVAGIMRAGAGDDNSKSTKAKDILKKVAVTILLLGLSGVILRLINPNFFG